MKNKDIRNQIIQMQITLKSFLKTIEHLISEEEAQFKEFCENKEVINLIQITIEDYYDLERNSTHIKTRKREIVKARQLIYWFLCEYKIGSLSFIGKAIGNKDHATVLNSKKVVNNLCETDKKYRAEFEDIKLVIQNKLQNEN